MSYTDYQNSTYRSDNIEGGVQFSDAWNEGARYQQLRGGKGTANADLDAQFASLGSRDSSETGTVADDGEGWVLLKSDGGTTDKDRVQNYRAIAEKWQAAGYDVRVQDHNPEFGEKKTSEIAIRKSGGGASAPEPEVISDPSDKIVEAKERVKEYEDYRWSGEHADDLFHDSADTTTDTPVDPNKYELDLKDQAKQDLLTNTAVTSQQADVGQQFKDKYMQGMMQDGSSPVKGDTKLM